MNCPVCKDELVMSERLGVEIDYCPKCRGVWLDRGELDKILERSAREEGAAPTEGYGDREASRRFPAEGHGYPGAGQRRRKSFLGNLFDFD
jgi:Zn-finger nucleic acid-binding protein